MSLCLVINACADDNKIFLLMAELDDCPYCAKWDLEIGAIYSKTSEGRAAPLKRFYLNTKQTKIVFTKPVNVSPTFILVQNNKEVGRIVGYTNDEQFWSLLSILFADANIKIN
jgi:thioredoxin-related protein